MRHDYKGFHSLLLLFAIPWLGGCSIAMALHGDHEPNFDAFEEGSSRKQVETQLRNAVSERVLEDGKKEVRYQYEVGNSPNGARATLYFYYDLATFGLAEPVFTLIELFQGHKEESQIVYDAGDRVVSIQGYKPPQPTAAMKAALEEQERYKKNPVVFSEPSVKHKHPEQRSPAGTDATAPAGATQKLTNEIETAPAVP